jgi:hypothetical protein
MGFISPSHSFKEPAPGPIPWIQEAPKSITFEEPRGTVLIRPPILLFESKTVTVHPASVSCLAAARPAAPEPMIKAVFSH